MNYIQVKIKCIVVLQRFISINQLQGIYKWQNKLKRLTEKIKHQIIKTQKSRILYKKLNYEFLKTKLMIALSFYNYLNCNISKFLKLIICKYHFNNFFK